MTRQIVLDTETTGLEPEQGHRIIEIGCVEMLDRRLTGNNFHQYLQPDREIDAAAIEVHGITNEFLADKPRFADVARDFIDYVKGAELIIHNAPFDVGFIDHELRLMASTPARPGMQGICPEEADHEALSGTSGRERRVEPKPITELCAVTDTLVMAKRIHPGQRNSLDALCKRYAIDNSHRELHGALLDAEILADVYLMMTGGQTALMLDANSGDQAGEHLVCDIRRLSAERPRLRVVKAAPDELATHELRLDAMGESCVWREE